MDPGFIFEGHLRGIFRKKVQKSQKKKGKNRNNLSILVLKYQRQKTMRALKHNVHKALYHGRGRRIRTLNKGFGDPRVTITPCPYCICNSAIIGDRDMNVKTFSGESARQVIHHDPGRNSRVQRFRTAAHRQAETMRRDSFHRF